VCEKSSEVHFTLVKSGNAAVNVWRHKHPNEHLKLNGFTFSSLNLASIDFSKAMLEGSKFEHCDLSNSDFSHTVLKSTTFVDCNLSCVDFKGASLKKTNFDCVDLANADFRESSTISQIGRLTLKFESLGFPKYDQSGIPLWDKFFSWDKLRFMKSINILVPSYGGLILTVLYLNGVSAYNLIVSKLNSIIVDAPEFAHFQLIEFAEPGTRHIWVLVAFLFFAIASTVFLICPSRITDFSREEWGSRLRQPLLIYDHSSWSMRWLRILCSSLLLAGGLIAAIILGLAIYRQVEFIATHTAQNGAL